ncbi:MAG TPA: PAS domain S-box protein [Terriglobales bacterium]
MPEGSSNSGEETFHQLLLQFSVAGAGFSGTTPEALISHFCRATQEFFRVDGAYYWQSISEYELVGAEADGWMAEAFLGRRMKAHESAVVMRSIRERRAIYENGMETSRFPMAAEFRAKALMAVPLVVSGEVIGAMAFLHTSVPEHFNDDMAAKATILAAQLGSLLEAGRLSRNSREEQRRSEILAEVAQALHAVPDAAAVMEALCDRLCILLNAGLVCVLLREDPGFVVGAVASNSPSIASSARTRMEGKALRFASDLAWRAITGGEVITVAFDSSTHGLTDLAATGTLMVAPLRTSRTKGALLIYPRTATPFSPAEKWLVAAVAGLGAVAIANAELYTIAESQAQELHHLLEISSELGAISDLDKFMQRFVVRAAEFLGFGRGFVALLEDGQFQIRWGSDRGEARSTNAIFPEGVATRALLSKQPFWGNDVTQIPGVQLETLKNFNVKELLIVPLLGTHDQVLGLVGVADHLQEFPITEKDVRRAQALASQMAICLEATHNLHLSEQHRHRADSLMQLALELNSFQRLPEFAKEFVARAQQMTEARAAVMLVQQGSGLEVAASIGSIAALGSGVLRRMSSAVLQALNHSPEAIVHVPSAEILDESSLADLGWQKCTLMRLQGATGVLAGVLVLADCTQAREPQAREPQAREPHAEQILQAIAGHGSIALENAQLFNRMEQANRHWIEIFDAISDFIVVHDAFGNVLRVNRSLADFIGLDPKQIIGLNMRAVLSMGKETQIYACPFCLTTGGAPDEYIHPVFDRTYLVSTSNVHGATGESLQTIHVMKDITDRREAERRYRELFDNIQEGVFFSTPEGTFIEVNDAMVRMLGFLDRQDLLSADLRMQIYSTPEGHKEFTDQMEQSGIIRNYEASLRRRDGSLVHVLINAFAVRDRQGYIIQHRGLMLDISGLKNSQFELQRERDFSGKILNNTQSLILVVDTAGLISYANRRWFDLGYEQSNLLGRPLHELVAATRHAAFIDAFRSVLQGQQVDNLDLQILQEDGHIGHFSVNLSPMRDEQGHVTSLVVVMTDITDAAVLQAKLMHAEKMAAVGQLVSGVAHEVNNPLTAILGFTDLLMESPDIPDAARRDLRVILQEAQRTKQIVQNLLSFARQMPPQRKPVQVNGILRRTVQLRAYDLQNHGVAVIEQLDQHLPAVVGDSQQLQQVFLNILNNAYDAVREVTPARIEIMTTRAGDQVEISFRDNGHGVTQAARVFDPFFTTKEVGEGTGLGLSICYGIVREHGGEILCQNNAGSDGATFIVRLPAAPEATSVGAAAGVIQR